MKPNKLYFKGAWMDFHSGPAKVTGFTNEGVHFTDRFGFGISSGADPIRLTSEILEKNGWRYNDNPFVQGWEQYGLTIVNNRITCGQNVSIKVEFIHELQLVLWLCGIEKEIIL